MVTGTFLIRGARQLLTLHGVPIPRRGPDLKELGIIHDGAVLVRDGVVQQVGTTRRVENLAEAREAVEISAAGRVVMPGFIDAHTHLVCPPPCAPTGDRELVMRRIRTSSAKRLAGRLRPQLEALVRHGTTTVEIKTCGMWDEEVDVKLLRVVAALANRPLEAVSSFLFCLPKYGPDLDAEASERMVSAWQQFLPKLAKRRLAASACLGLGDDESRWPMALRLLQTASDAGLATKLHLEAGGAARALALVGGRNAVSIEHTERATAEDVEALANFPGVVTVSPTTDFPSSEAGAGVRRLVDAGIAIALASDFHPGYAPTFNMQAVMALARLQLHLTAEEAIAASTINGAHALGCAARAGSLEVGKQADLLILNAADYREACTQLGSNLVHLTMKRGAFIYKEDEVMCPTNGELQVGG